MSQGKSLKSLLDESKPNDAQVGVESPDDVETMDEEGKPKGVSIEKVEVMGKPKEVALEDQNQEEMTPEELEELLQKLG